MEEEKLCLGKREYESNEKKKNSLENFVHILHHKLYYKNIF